MASNALNQIYKTGILAIEESVLTADVSIGSTSLTVSGYYMSNSPFAVGQSYVLRDNSWAGATAVSQPNAERVQVESISGLTATANGDGIGYHVAGTITILGLTSNGYAGGTLNAYTMANGASILTPGMEMAIQSSDFNCRFKTLQDAPKIDFDDEASRFATGDEGRDLSIAGARTGEITFTQKLAWGGSVTAMPVWAKLFRAMGHASKPYTTKGIGFLPTTWSNETTATIWILNPENGANPSALVYRYRGAHGGNGSSLAVSKVGDVYMATYKYSASFVGTTSLPYSAVRVLTSPEHNKPEVMMSNLVSVPAVFGHAVASPSTYASVSALVTGESVSTGSRIYTADGTDTTDGALATAKGSVINVGDSFTITSSSAVTYIAATKNVEISQFSLDFGGVVNPLIDQSNSTGQAYYATQDRDPRLSMNPYLVKKDSDDVDFIVSNNISGTVKIQSALINPHITIELPNAQLLNPALASREGYSNTGRVYRALRNNITGTAVDTAMPDWAMYEILIGARS